jgi:hypothetical protein
VRRGRELATHDLARGVAGQFLDHADVARHLEARDVLAAPGLERPLVEPGALLQLDEREGDLAAHTVDHPDDRGLLDALVTVEDLLDLAREDILTADDEHLLDAARDRQHAALVDAAHVA